MDIDTRTVSMANSMGLGSKDTADTVDKDNDKGIDRKPRRTEWCKTLRESLLQLIRYCQVHRMYADKIVMLAHTKWARRWAFELGGVGLGGRWRVER